VSAVPRSLFDVDADTKTIEERPRLSLAEDTLVRSERFFWTLRYESRNDVTEVPSHTRILEPEPAESATPVPETFLNVVTPEEEV